MPAAPSDWVASTHTDNADVAQAGAARGAGAAAAAVVAHDRGAESERQGRAAGDGGPADSA